MFSRFFIDRPIFATVLCSFILIAGLASLATLPVARFPDIAPAVVTVVATYPGASAQVLDETVATPLEDAINGVQDMLYIQSTSSSNGVTQIQVTFNVGADADLATTNVNNRVNQALPRVPLEVRRQGVRVEKGSNAFLQVIAIYSETPEYDELFTSNYVTLNVVDKIKRLHGVGYVRIFGEQDYSMRLWLRPDRLAQLQMTPGDIIAAVNEQNSQFAVGKVGEPPIAVGQELSYTINTKGRLSTPEEFDEIIIRANADGGFLKLKDVARVELGAANSGIIGKANGKPATLVAVFTTPEANALTVGSDVMALIEELSKDFPKGITYVVPYDATKFIRVSIKQVIVTLLEAMVLVFLVVFLFLQNWRATLVPFAAVPISLIGTLAGLHLMGYSINTLTLFGMVLSIGIVVDDAIVVLENTARLMKEKGLKGREAAILTMQEVTGPVIAIVLVLCAVFVPIAFLGGLTGELYRQFSVTISISVIISGFVALTLTPSLCALNLAHSHRPPGRFFRAFNHGFERVTDHYENGVAWMIRHGRIALCLFGAMLIATVILWRLTPTSLLPDEDQGYFVTAIAMPDGTSLQRTAAFADEVEGKIKSNPFNEHTMSFTGLDFITFTQREDAATMFTAQIDWHERDMGIQQLLGEFYGKTAGFTEGLALSFGPPAILGLGRTGGFEFFIQNHGTSGSRGLAAATELFLAAAAKNPRLMMTNTFWRWNVPQLYVEVDREKAKQKGVDIGDLFATLSATMGTYYINDFNRFGHTWQVLISADPEFRKSPEDIGNVYVRSVHGDMIPLSALATIEYTSGPVVLDRYNNASAVRILGSASHGVSSGEAIAEIEKMADEVLPNDFTIDWTGASLQEKRTGSTSTIVLILGALMAFLILAAQYEMWSLPFSAMLAVPFGIFGAVVAVNLRGMSNDVYFQIGLVTLLGLAAKNAILIVAFALMKTHEGFSVSAAAVEAARIRFRPILMTSLAFIFGVLPLAISSGAGAAARRSVGTGVMGGMIAATFLAIFFVPFFYKFITERRIAEPRSTDEIKAEAAERRQKAEGESIT